MCYNNCCVRSIAPILNVHSITVCLGKVGCAAPEGHPVLGVAARPLQQGGAPLGLRSPEEHFIRPRPREQDRHQELRWSACTDQVAEKNP